MAAVAGLLARAVGGEVVELTLSGGRWRAKPIPGLGVLITEIVTEKSEFVLEWLSTVSNALEPLPVGLILIEAGPGGTSVLGYNQRYTDILGFQPDVGAPFGSLPYKVFRKDRRTPYPQTDLPGPVAARSRERVFDRELHVLRPDGQWRVLSASAAPIDNREGRSLAIACLLDVTERFDAERAIAKSYERYRAIVDHISDMLVLFEPKRNERGEIEDWRLCDASDAIAEALGLMREDLIGASASALLPENTARVRERWARVLETGETHRYEMSHGNRSYLVRAFRVDESTVGSASIDITERQQAEARVHTERERLRVTLESIGDAVITTDAQARVTMLNPVAVALTGVSPEQAVGRPLQEVFDIRNELTDTPVESPADLVLREGRIVGLANHTVLVARDGSRRPIADSGAPIWDAEGAMIGVVIVFRDQSLERTAQDAIERSRSELRALIERIPVGVFVTRGDRIIYANPTFCRYVAAPQGPVGRRPDELLAPTDHPMRWRVRAQGPPKRPNTPVTTLELGETRPISLDGKPATLRIALDRTELVETQARLVQSDRLAAIGTLAAAVAHEINNPLTYVIPALDFLAEHFPSTPEQEEISRALAEAREGAARVEHVVRDLKQISREGGEAPSQEIVDLQAALRSAIRLASNEIRHRAELVLDLGETPPVLGDEPALSRVFLNLLLNAAQAIPPRPSSARDEIRVYAGKDPRGFALIEIRDTGMGIPEGLLGSVFDAFFTTKPVGVGTGLGLWICKKTVQRHGGEIAIESVEGRGTTVRITLPPAQTPKLPALARSPLPEAKTRGKVLVVDDEPSIGSALKRMLSRDHDVTALERAEVARDRITAGERFDVILCDVMMRDMSGPELWQAISQIAPEQAERVVFISGGAFQPEAAHFLRTSGLLCLEKPFDSALVRRVVGDLARKPW